MTDDTVRDGLARALFAARLADGDYPDGTGGWDDVPEDWREACQVLADAALAHLAGQRVDVEVDALAAVRRGDADPTMGSEHRPNDCRARCGGWFCTRPAGHAGQHVAGDGSKVCEVWPNEQVAALLPTAPEVVTTAADAWDEGFRKGQASETSDPAFWTASKYANPYRPTTTEDQP